MARAAPMPMCPMAATCNRMMERPLSSLFMVVPGITFIALGVSIVVWPALLPWLVAAGCILAGGAMLLMAGLMREIGARLGRAEN